MHWTVIRSELILTSMVTVQQRPGGAGVRRLRNTSLQLKIVMAVTGAISVIYLVLHMIGNLKIFLGQGALDTYAEFLRTVGEPVLPYSTLLWIIRVVLTVSIVLHIVSATILARRAAKARPVKVRGHAEDPGFLRRPHHAVGWRDRPAVHRVPHPGPHHGHAEPERRQRRRLRQRRGRLRPEPLVRHPLLHPRRGRGRFPPAPRHLERAADPRPVGRFPSARPASGLDSDRGRAHRRGSSPSRSPSPSDWLPEKGRSAHVLRLHDRRPGRRHRRPRRAHRDPGGSAAASASSSSTRPTNAR